jgi:hypothetical protein
MEDQHNHAPADDLRRILEAAQRLGVEMDEEEALQWLTAIAVSRAALGQVVVDSSSGVFGHQASMLDFDPAELAYFRQVGHLVEFADEPPYVETALALSGSAAQSRIQTYPGDLDYFERVNIKAATREEACHILSRLMRDKVLSTMAGETYRLIEVKFGNYPCDVMRDGRLMKKGTPIAWKPEEVRDGKIVAAQPDGTPVTITWEEVAVDPGWCKLDWVVADPVRASVANASNMLDVTWEAPDGKITPLDGYLDPYFQEVYLDAESIPIFTKLAKQVDSNALDDYVAALEKEVRKYVTASPNYGKAAKRMYNIFRLTGKYEEAVRIIDAGFLLGIGGVITYKNAAPLREAVKKIPLSAMVVETDSPYLAPIPFRGRRNESSYLPYIIRAIAESRGLSPEEVTAATTQTACALFRLPSFSASEGHKAK